MIIIQINFVKNNTFFYWKVHFRILKKKTDFVDTYYSICKFYK